MTSKEPNAAAAGATQPAWDTSSHEDFFKYYEKQSLSPKTMDRFRTTTETLLRIFAREGREGALDVLDIGCGAGAQGQLWLERGHRYRGIDINQPLIQLAQERARQQHLNAEFKVGSATQLPFANASMDVCLLPFLLEHVVAWEACIDDALRVLRPGGLIYISTTSSLCPSQDEFNLPGYGWYPRPLKRYFEHRAVTDWPAVVNYAKYPAVNWFSVYQLGGYLAARGCTVLDRFDLMDGRSKGALARFVLAVLRGIGPARFFGHVLTPYTLVVGRKGN